MCVCVCVCVCARARVRACVRGGMCESARARASFCLFVCLLACFIVVVLGAVFCLFVFCFTRGGGGGGEVCCSRSV